MCIVCFDLNKYVNQTDYGQDKRVTISTSKPLCKLLGASLMTYVLIPSVIRFQIPAGKFL